MIVSEHAHRSPFAGENKVGLPIALEIAEYCAANQAEAGKHFCVHRIRFPTPAHVAKDRARSRCWKPSRDDPSADKQIEITVAVDVRQRERSGAGIKLRQTIDRHLSLQIVFAHTAAAIGAILVIRRAGQERHLACCPRPAEHGGLVARHQLVERRLVQRLEFTVSVIAISGEHSAFAARDHRVIQTIAIHVAPAHAGTKLTQLLGQQRLAHVIIEWRLNVGVIEQRTDVFEERRDAVGRFRTDLRGRALLGNFIHLIRLGVRHHGAPAAAPVHFDGQQVRHAAGGENSHGLIRGQITSARDHLLLLRHRSAENFDLRADACGVRRATLQPDRDARCAGVVAQKRGRVVEVVDDHIKVAVVIQVREQESVGYADEIKSPRLPHLRESEVVIVAEGDIGRGEARKQFAHLKRSLSRFQLPRRAHRLDSIQHVHAARITLMTVGDKYILPAVEIDIEERRAPRPLRGLQPGERRHFRVGAVAAIQIEDVARVLRAVIHFANEGNGRLPVWQKIHAACVIAAHHIDDENVIKSVAINVRHIHAHGEDALLAHRQTGQGAKFSAALVEPDAVRRIKVVAHVNVRQPVLVQIANHH